MSPHEIIEHAAAVGVVLYLDEEGQLSHLGELPKNWPEITAGWIEHRGEVIATLRDPGVHHRSRIARAMVARVIERKRAGSCLYLGELVNARPSCGCGALHSCSLHGVVTIHGRHSRYTSCTRCADYQPRGDS